MQVGRSSRAIWCPWDTIQLVPKNKRETSARQRVCMPLNLTSRAADFTRPSKFLTLRRLIEWRQRNEAWLRSGIDWTTSTAAELDCRLYCRDQSGNRRDLP